MVWGQYRRPGDASEIGRVATTLLGVDTMGDSEDHTKQPKTEQEQWNMSEIDLDRRCNARQAKASRGV